MTTIKGDRSVTIGGEIITILTATERAAKLGQAEAQAHMASRMLANGSGLSGVEAALIEARTMVGSIIRNDVAAKEHRRLARATKK